MIRYLNTYTYRINPHRPIYILIFIINRSASVAFKINYVMNF